jgi:hypothetical protein
MLIASMGNTYQRVIAISEKERIRQVEKKKTISTCCNAMYVIISSGLNWS